MRCPSIDRADDDRALVRSVVVAADALTITVDLGPETGITGGPPPVVGLAARGDHADAVALTTNGKRPRHHGGAVCYLGLSR